VTFHLTSDLINSHTRNRGTNKQSGRETLMLNEAQGARKQDPSPGIPPHPVDMSLCSSRDQHLISVKLIVLCVHQPWCGVWKGIHSLPLCYEQNTQFSRSSSTNACTFTVTSKVLEGSYQIRSPKQVEAYCRRHWIFTTRRIRKTSPEPFSPSLSMLIQKVSTQSSVQPSVRRDSI